MRVAVIDVGSNTARLLVADVEDDVRSVREEKVYLGLGADALRLGRLSDEKIAEAGRISRRFARLARKAGVERLETVVTAPGRQANADRLLHELATRTDGPVRVLSADDEGRLAHLGAVVREDAGLPDAVAVCDVGGGSTEIAVGSPQSGAAWVRSVDLGSLRLTRACLHADPPDGSEIREARLLVQDAFETIAPPSSELALAVGGSARAAAKVVGQTLGAEELEELVGLCSRKPSGKLARTFSIDAARAQTLLAGALLLAETSRRLGSSLRVARGGLREGAAVALAGRAEALAA